MICKICIHYHLNLHFPPFEICTSDCQYFFSWCTIFFSPAKVCSIAPYLNTFSLHFHFKAYIYQEPNTGSFVQIVIFWAKCVWQALHFFCFLEALSFWFCTCCNWTPCRKTEIFQGLLHLNILVVKWIFLRFLIILLQC